MVRAAWSVALLAGAFVALSAAPAEASDDDEDPPYLIYIDPETGRYTTVDPNVEGPDAAARSPAAPVTNMESPVDAPPERTTVIAVSAGVAAAVIAIAVAFRRRRDARRRHPAGRELKARSAR